MKPTTSGTTAQAKIIASSSKIQKNFRKKCKEREKKGLSPVEFSLVWSEFREKNQLCDGMVICDDYVKINIHRAILSSVSPYFKAHFTNSFNPGSPENTEAKVTAPSHIFTKILDFAYTGHCTIEEDNVEPLLRAADEYLVMGVVELCFKHILDRLQPTNCLRILRMARHYFCNDFEKEAKRYIRQNFVKFLNEGTEFDNLTMEEFVQILEGDELNVRNEELVYDAIRRWINVNAGEREMHILPLLKCVRWGNLPTTFLTDNVLAWSLVAKNVDCQSYVMEIIDSMDTTRNNVDINNVLWRPRVPYDIIFAIGGSNEENYPNFIETYDPRAKRWLLSVGTHKTPRAHHGLCSLNGYIYMIGGTDGDEYFNTTIRFDPVNHKRSKCACMHYPRRSVSVVVHDNKIYAIGGDDGLSNMNSAERYNPRYNQWELIKPMQTERASAGAAVLNDKIYIVGGDNVDEHTLSSAEVYDTLADQWTFIPHMLSARAGVSLVAFKNTIYALGGYNEGNHLRTGEKLTPGVSIEWEAIKEMFIARSNFAAVVLEDLIVVIAGFDDVTDLKHVECYNTDTNEWTVVSPMNMGHSALGACVLSGLSNATDYSLMGSSKLERRRWLQDKLELLKKTD